MTFEAEEDEAIVKRRRTAEENCMVNNRSLLLSGISRVYYFVATDVDLLDERLIFVTV